MAILCCMRYSVGVEMKRTRSAFILAWAIYYSGYLQDGVSAEDDV